MSNFEQKLLAALRQAVKEVYDLEPEEGLLLIETPKDPKRSSPRPWRSGCALCCRRRRASPWPGPAF